MAGILGSALGLRFLTQEEGRVSTDVHSAAALPPAPPSPAQSSSWNSSRWVLLTLSRGGPERSVHPARSTQQLSVMAAPRRRGALCSLLAFDFNEGNSWQPLVPGLGHKSPNGESLRSC